MFDFTKRPRRLRQHESIRKLVQDTVLSVDDLVYPIFLYEGQDKEVPIETLYGQNRYSIEGVLHCIEHVVAKGIRAIALFPSIDDLKKNSSATEALNEKGLIPNALKMIKKHFPDLLIITDIALDPFSSDGHDGLVKDGQIINDETVSILAEMALLHASCGADIVAPSDMMDGRVGQIRKQLDKHGLINTMILSYCLKYASSLYGPFRDALQSAPKSGDKKTYQMDYANRGDLFREADLDIEEGADFLLVKPAAWYLDVIRDLREYVTVPVAGYHVSGEYSMLKLAAKHNMLDFQVGLREVLTSIKRAGASFIFTYGALELEF